MTTDTFRDKSSHEEILDGSKRSASVVVPLLLRHLSDIRSVIDFGCGAGVWLAEFSLCGVPRVTGLDIGHGTEKYLFIPRESFRVEDLSHPILGVERHDLAISIEVAEHLPELAAEVFIANVTSASDLVMFSAAAPLQAGHDHVNEHYPSYWIQLFRKKGFRCFDVIRPLIWTDKRIDWWYRQNLLLFVREGVSVPGLQSMASFQGCDLVHPDHVASRFRAGGSGQDDAETWSRIAWARDNLTDPVRVSRSALLRRALRTLSNVERGSRKVLALLKGQSKREFKERWEARRDRRLIARSGLFDPAWYTMSYPDVAASGLTPFKHFLRFGLLEDRDPGPLFSTRWYAAHHPWIVETGVHPLLHYLREIALPWARRNR